MPRRQKQEVSQTKKNPRKGRQTTPETPFDETSSVAGPAGDAETNVRADEPVEASAEVEQTASETATAERAGEGETEGHLDGNAGTPADVERSTNETATAKPAGEVETDVRFGETVETSIEVEQAATDEATGQPAVAAVEEPPAGDAQPELDTQTALALKRWRERPTCCCGCGQPLSSAKKNFVQGHDGRAKKIIRRIMKGELPAGEAPAELILRHAEIKFVMGSPEFGRVVEAWREICGLTDIAARK